MATEQSSENWTAIGSASRKGRRSGQHKQLLGYCSATQCECLLYAADDTTAVPVARVMDGEHKCSTTLVARVSDDEVLSDARSQLFFTFFPAEVGPPLA